MEKISGLNIKYFLNLKKIRTGKSFMNDFFNIPAGLCGCKKKAAFNAAFQEFKFGNFSFVA